MNIERLETIAEWLEVDAPHTDGSHGFNMDGFLVDNSVDYAGRDCGTVMCIGGAAVQFFGNTSHYSVEHEAAFLLDLDKEQSSQLFYPEGLRQHFEDDLGWDWNEIKPQDAAKVIRHLIKTGEVNWEIILDD